jgi:hypothetical protein
MAHLSKAEFAKLGSKFVEVCEDLKKANQVVTPIRNRKKDIQADMVAWMKQNKISSVTIDGWVVSRKTRATKKLDAILLEEALVSKLPSNMCHLANQIAEDIWENRKVVESDTINVKDPNKEPPKKKQKT